ncbi:DUF1761 family protein [Schizosaccharomyces cryophilus OY26]|uniref:DUF1761 family protein n=1 Tax=Schizosaccharomyces cryophilus (strain OY26 / ATCC MYA-4695 / CBS 11777 / NBRC 106824 / NRRL Y48691) TaxID=653667 RepID=S9W380_SCHCR|nr:DUF1761 family protein [Schizosaccharomyces cryophilus OY26]EPY53014.1 DUF1761 family protein [Schizosaccharomyces cryophilus OY26]
MSLVYSLVPYVRPSAIVLGVAFDHAASFMVYGPLMGDLWKKAMSPTPQHVHSAPCSPIKKATITYSSNLISACVQTYSIAALLQLTGTVSMKGAFYVGLYVFGASGLPDMVDYIFTEKRGCSYTLVKTISSFVKTVGMSVVLLGYGIRQNRA